MTVMRSSALEWYPPTVRRTKSFKPRNSTNGLPRDGEAEILGIVAWRPVRTRQPVRTIQAAAAASDRRLTVRTSSRVESKTTVRLLHSLPKMANQRCDRPSHTLLSPDKRSLSNAVQESGRRRFWSLGTCFASAPRDPTKGNNSRNFLAKEEEPVACGGIRDPETDSRT